jgi:putative membrane protein
MTTVKIVAIVIVALLHFYFLILEMFLWTKPAGLRAFGLTPEKAEASKVLAANQGLYNGFLGAGLLWSLTQGTHSFHLAIFFLTCVIIAGLYGAATANKKILYVQALPAIVALVLIHIRTH